MRTRKSANEYSVANIFTDAVNVTTLHADGFLGLESPEVRGNPEMTIYYPKPDKSDREAYKLKVDQYGDVDSESEGYYEWLDGFFPVMHAIWPIELPYRRDANECANAIAKMSSMITLISIGTRSSDEQYYLAMSEGGMDLSYYIAAAYVACGCVPPVGLTGRSWAHEGKPAVKRKIAAAMRQGAKHIKFVAKHYADAAAKVSREARDALARRRADKQASTL